MNLTSVQLNDGSGDYLAALDVYHHLHCLKLVKQYIHPEYYVMGESLMVGAAEHIGRTSHMTYVGVLPNSG
jgi:Mycotoxin biosynthesis protein UstYa